MARRRRSTPEPAGGSADGWLCAIPPRAASSPARRVFLRGGLRATRLKKLRPFNGRSIIRCSSITVPIAPGELLSIFGAHLVDGIAGPAPAPWSFPTSFAGVTVTMNGIASPLLYVSAQQINLQAPYEISINPNPGAALNLSITNNLLATVVSAVALPGSISGVWHVDVRMPLNQGGAMPISLFVDSVPVRDSNLTIWTREAR